MNDEEVLATGIIGDRTIRITYSMFDKKSQQLIDDGILSKGLLKGISFDGQANKFVAVEGSDK